jgi:hypothetical protein
MHPNKNKSHFTWSDYNQPCPKNVVDKEMGLSGVRPVGLAYRSELQRLDWYDAAEEECARGAESSVARSREPAESSDAGLAPKVADTNLTSGASCL